MRGQREAGQLGRPLPLPFPFSRVVFVVEPVVEVVVGELLPFPPFPFPPEPEFPLPGLLLPGRLVVVVLVDVLVVVVVVGRPWLPLP